MNKRKKRGGFLNNFTKQDAFPPGGRYEPGCLNGLGGGLYYGKQNKFLQSPRSTVGGLGISKGGRRSRRRKRRTRRRRKRRTRRRRRHRKGKDFDAALKRVIAQHRRSQIARGDKRFKATRGLVKWSRPNKTKRKNRIYYRKRKTRRRKRKDSRRQRGGSGKRLISNFLVGAREVVPTMVKDTLRGSYEHSKNVYNMYSGERPMRTANVMDQPIREKRKI